MGTGSTASELLVYLGGAVSSREYAARRESTPTPVLRLLTGAGRPVSVLVLTYPPGLPGRPEQAAEPFLRHFQDELLPRLPVPPDRIAVLGYSLGAALAVFLARAKGMPVVRLATIGAVGATEALLHRAPAFGSLACPVRVFWNAEDPCAPHSLGFAAALREVGSEPETATGGGGHRFADYVESGLMLSAVSFAVASAIPPSRAAPGRPFGE